MHFLVVLTICLLQLNPVTLYHFLVLTVCFCNYLLQECFGLLRDIKKLINNLKIIKINKTLNSSTTKFLKSVRRLYCYFNTSSDFCYTICNFLYYSCSIITIVIIVIIVGANLIFNSDYNLFQLKKGITGITFDLS